MAIDADTKLVVSYRVGPRDLQEAQLFIQDVAKRLRHRVQLTTDAHRPYLTAVEGAFDGKVDYAQLVKLYGRTGDDDPDPSHISTSYIERQNLTMSMRRFTRLTNAFSKKLENLAAAVSLQFAYYNFCRVHRSLSGKTPAMAAGVTDYVWKLGELIALLEDAEAVTIKRGAYRKTRERRASNSE